MPNAMTSAKTMKKNGMLTDWEPTAALDHRPSQNMSTVL